MGAKGNAYSVFDGTPEAKMQLGKHRCTWQNDIKMDQITQERCMYSGIAKYFVIHECVIYWSYQLIKLEFRLKCVTKLKEEISPKLRVRRVGSWPLPYTGS
jgi:hypothetical protein